jgi:hypothetical protein
VSAGALHALRAALRSEPGLLGELARAAANPANADGAGRGSAAGEGGPAQLAASGPRAAGRRERYELLLELILEGSLLHYGEPRLIRPSDPDLGLLLGDQLYALGLTRLAELGDLEAVRELADVISLISQAALDGDVELIDDVWRAGAAAIGWGGDLRHEQAKSLARSGRLEAGEALRASAERRAGAAGRAGDAPARSWR